LDSRDYTPRYCCADIYLQTLFPAKAVEHPPERQYERDARAYIARGAGMEGVV